MAKDGKTVTLVGNDKGGKLDKILGAGATGGKGGKGK